METSMSWPIVYPNYDIEQAYATSTGFFLC